MGKRVLLLVVDGCTSRVLGPALEAGDLPLLAELAGRGTLKLDCVSIFPSITPAATASIATGRYPAQHGISGMSWWNPSTGDVSYFGDDVWTVLQRRAGEFLRGFLLRLNGERLQAPTIFQVVERQGRKAACFNHLIFHGDVPHEVSQPLLLRLLPSVSARLTVHGPSWLCLGDFVSTTGGRHDVDSSGGLFNRFGMDDQGTAGFLRDIPNAAALPDFSLAYFADYDFNSHEQGPVGALSTLRRLDDRLRDIFDHWGGLDRVLDETCVMMTADHSHCDVGEGSGAAIVLDEVLSGYRCADPAAGWQNRDEVLLCPNMRAAEVYIREHKPERVRNICRKLLQDERIDHVIWREPREPGDDFHDFHVATSDRGSLRFRRGSGGSDAARDDYGTSWEIRGDLTALDMSINGGRIRYREYPNALERIANGVDYPRAGRLWVTARPGYEFQVPGQSVHHKGSSHGTLHALDSLVPLLMAGQPDDVELHATPRIVDAVPLSTRVIGIPFDVGPGEGR